MSLNEWSHGLCSIILKDQSSLLDYQTPKLLQSPSYFHFYEVPYKVLGIGQFSPISNLHCLVDQTHLGALTSLIEVLLGTRKVYHYLTKEVLT